MAILVVDRHNNDELDQVKENASDKIWHNREELTMGHFIGRIGAPTGGKVMGQNGQNQINDIVRRNI